MQQNQVTVSSGGNQVASPSSNAVQCVTSVKVDDLNKVLDDVNTIKSKQKMVDDSLFAVKK